MIRNIAKGFVKISGVIFLLSASAWAHHSFTAEFDIYQPVEFNNPTITKVDWINPHCYIYVDAKDASNKTVSWKVESWGTGNLHRSGLTQAKLAPGTVLTYMRGYKAKDGSNLAYLRDLTFSDGTKMELWIGGVNGSPDQQR